MMTRKRIHKNRGFVLFLVSFCAAGYMLCLFHILRFYFFPTNIGINMLLVGFPLGGLLAVKYIRPTPGRFLRTISLLRWAMVISLILCFVYSRFAYVRSLWSFAHIEKINFTAMVAELVGVILLFLPYFIVYGAVEFTGYRLGTRLYPRRFGFIYALFLSGAAAAYITITLLLPAVGLIRIIFLLLAVTGILTLDKNPSRKIFNFISLAVLAVFIVTPVIPGKCLRLLEGDFPLSVQAAQKEGARVLYQKWTHQGYLALTYHPTRRTVRGFYNNHFFWSTGPVDQAVFPIEISPFALMKDDAGISIIGSGGGRQVAQALRFDPRQVTAVDIDGTLLRLLKGEFRSYVDGVYNDPRVTTVAADGRKFHRLSDQPFDLIYICAVGGSHYALNYYLEPSLTLHTHQALTLLSERLSAEGMIAIFRPQDIDPYDILLRQEFRSLKQLGLNTFVIKGPRSYVLIAHKGTIIPQQIERLGTTYTEFFGGNDLSSYSYRILYQMPQASLSTDNAPLPPNAILFRTYFPTSSLIRVPLIFLTLIGISFFFLIRFLKVLRARENGIPQNTFTPLVGLSILVGINFIALENMIIFRAFWVLSNPTNAAIVGSFYFLIWATIGSLISRQQRISRAVHTAAVAAAIALSTGKGFPAPVTAFLLIPLAVSTGTFFPQLFGNRQNTNRMITVFAADTMGTALGMFLTIFIAWLAGFSFFYLSAQIFYCLCLGAFCAVKESLPIE